ncbi:MAG: hypothetical protein JW724_02970 [Candidatus Altiarchaeota archaeon]|nr:hypothetical protein [Candidatus Altiarchaeota archaeon]
MKNRIEDILKEGYLVWRKNLVLGLPPLLGGISVLVAIIAAAVCMVAVAVVFFGALIVNIGGGGYPQGDYSAIYPAAIPFILALAAVTALFIVVILLANAFFASASIGMSAKALETGKTEAGDITYYGRRNMWQIFSASILMILINIAGLLFFIPAIAALVAGFLNVAISFLVLGLVALIAYVTIAGLLLILTPYSIVAGDLGAVEGLRASYSTVMKNKLPVVLMWFAVMGLEAGFGIVANVFTSGMGAIPFIGTFLNIGLYVLYAIFNALFLVPITMLWWTDFYWSRAAKVKKVSHHRPSRHPTPEPSAKQPEIYM